ncbi:uncharacterized protein LOC124267637 [Haliotis rubra]|uniref:uncharacterized protein LOC124267637 n=1 Tax=Haliotis rubra TaxID=36100 RepID=UPI001EE546BC|nr:uncharacterized protein LOC124267637 [Haliotis rubra]
MIEEFSPVSPNIMDWDTDDFDDSLLVEAVEGMSTSVDDDDCVIIGWTCLLPHPSPVTLPTPVTSPLRGASCPTSSLSNRSHPGPYRMEKAGSGEWNTGSST